MTGPTTAAGSARPTSLDEVIDLVLRQGLGAADLFGPLAAGPGQEPEAALRAARRAYRAMARLAHPDLAPARRRSEAAAAFARLAELWEAHEGRGRDPDDLAGLTATDRDRRVHTVGAVYAEGDIAVLRRVARVETEGDGDAVEDPAHLVKIARSADDDDLIAREGAALRRIARLGDDRYAPYVPELVATARLVDPRGARRRVNLLGRLDGFYSLAQVCAAYPGGLDVRDAAWMWRRMLVGLGYAHRAGVAHGAVLPDHVLIHPEQHGLVLVDWCYSAVPDPADGAVVAAHRGPLPAGADDPARRVPAVVERYRDWYPVEVTRREPPSAATDLAMASRCVSYLLGDPQPARLGPAVPTRVRRFLAGCVLESPAMRPDDAWALLGELDELLGALYGPRRFRPFSMPGAAPA